MNVRTHKILIKALQSKLQTNLWHIALSAISNQICGYAWLVDISDVVARILVVLVAITMQLITHIQAIIQWFAS